MTPHIVGGMRWLATRQASLARRLMWWVLAALLVVWADPLDLPLNAINDSWAV